MTKSTQKIVSHVLALTLLLGMLLGGCGSQPNTPAKPAAGTDASSEAPSNMIGQNVQFDPNKSMSGNYTVWFYEDGKRFIDPLFQDYMKHRPNVKLEVTYIPWGDYWKKLPVAISSGTGPDLFYFHNMYDNLMVEGGQLEPYPQNLVDKLSKDYLNIPMYAQGGKTYYVGVGGGHGIIYYNKDMWAAAGLTDADIPQTWAKLRENAIKMTKQEGDKLVVSGFNPNGNWGPFSGDIQLLSGRFIYGADGKTVMYDNPDFKKNLQFFIDLYTKDNVCTPTFPDAIQSFQDGTTAMLWQHPWMSGVLTANKPDLNFGVFAIPKFDGMARNWHYNNPDVSMGINPKASKEGKAFAEDLLTLFFAEDKYMKSWNLAQGLAPTKISLTGDAEMMNNPILKVIMSDYDNSCYQGTGPVQIGDDLIQSMIQPILLNGVDIDTAVKAGVDKCNQTLADFNFTPVERKWVHAGELQ